MLKESFCKVIIHRHEPGYFFRDLLGRTVDHRAAATRLDQEAGIVNSLFRAENSLFGSKNSLLCCLGNLAKKPENAAT